MSEQKQTPPCQCTGGPCYWTAEVKIVPVLGWELYGSHKGPRLRYPNGATDYASRTELALVDALFRMQGQTKPAVDSIRELIESPNAKANDMWDRARAALQTCGGSEMILKSTQAAFEPVPATRVQDKEPHVHEYKKVPKSERTDRMRFVCAMFRCKCGDFYWL